ncbi:MAG: hypothetical protein V4722_20335 [Bacteroidota bacterium]
MVVFKHATAQTYLRDVIEGTVINNSNANNLNINHTGVVLLQEVKKATIFFLNERNGELIGGTGTLVNSTKNSIDPSTGSKVMYILTASHNIIGAGSSFYIYLSADYEMAHATNRGSDDRDVNITRIIRVQVKVLVDDPAADIALLQLIAPDLPEGTNLYAAGWSLSPARLWANISHPMRITKRVLLIRQS